MTKAAGRNAFRVTAPSYGVVSVQLKSAGDWDVAVFGAEHRLVAAAAGFAGNELAEGFVRKDERLIVRACRYRGDAATADVSVRFTAIEQKSTADKVQVVDVRTRQPADKQRLQALGLDLTEHGDANSVEVVLHGNRDAPALRSAGFRYRVRIADLGARTRRNTARDRRFARASAVSALPSGRTGYRHLADYDVEMKQLAARYPLLVKPLTLKFKSVLGRDVNGIEITTDPANVQDGKPIFLANVGVHHAREWPSSEHAMEFAYDLLRNYGVDARTTSLVQRTRNDHRAGGKPGRVQHLARGRAAWRLLALRLRDEAQELQRVAGDAVAVPPPATCDDNKAGRLRGTDPNRNYGGLWGGAGASVTWSDDTFRGDSPFSEPEVRNIRELVSTRQVTNLITNHTYSNLVLRPPGVADFGFPLEQPQYKALGAAMTAHNGYSNDPSFGLYDTTGATEDWTFWSAGGFGFTFEIGPNEFHPPYATGVEAEYVGLAPAAGAGKGGNREAYYTMLAATADPVYHSLIEGAAPIGSTLKISKSFQTSTSPCVAGSLSAA